MTGTAIRWAAAVLVLWGAAAGQAQQLPKPIEKGNLLQALRTGRFPTERALPVIRSQGVDFVVTPAVELELRGAGAENRLVDAVRDNYRPETLQVSGLPLARNEVVLLLQAGVTETVIGLVAEKRKVLFETDGGTTALLRAAGANPALLGQLSFSRAEGEKDPLLGPAAPPAVPFPVSRQGFWFGLRFGDSVNKLAGELERRGNSFTLTPEEEVDLKKAGVGAKLIELAKREASSSPNPAGAGLSRSGLFLLLALGVPESEIERLAGARTVDFELTAETVARMQEAGASGRLVAFIGKRPRSSGAEVLALTGAALGRDDVLLLLQAGASETAIGWAAQKRKVLFAMDPPTADLLSAAGAGPALLDQFAANHREGGKDTLTQTDVMPPSTLYPVSRHGFWTALRAGVPLNELAAELGRRGASFALNAEEEAALAAEGVPGGLMEAVKKARKEAADPGGPEVKCNSLLLLAAMGVPDLEMERLTGGKRLMACEVSEVAGAMQRAGVSAGLIETLRARPRVGGAPRREVEAAKKQENPDEPPRPEDCPRPETECVFRYVKMPNWDPAAPFGECTLNVVVDGTIDVYFSGVSIRYHVQNAGQPTGGTVRCSQPFPKSSAKVAFKTTTGRGKVTKVADPSPDNNFTFSLRIQDEKSGRAPYAIVVSWTR